MGRFLREAHVLFLFSSSQPRPFAAEGLSHWIVQHAEKVSLTGPAMVGTAAMRFSKWADVSTDWQTKRFKTWTVQDLDPEAASI
jgi:hypothetical protein